MWSGKWSVRCAMKVEFIQSSVNAWMNLSAPFSDIPQSNQWNVSHANAHVWVRAWLDTFICHVEGGKRMTTDTAGTVHHENLWCAWVKLLRLFVWNIVWDHIHEIGSLALVLNGTFIPTYSYHDRLLWELIVRHAHIHSFIDSHAKLTMMWGGGNWCRMCDFPFFLSFLGVFITEIATLSQIWYEWTLDWAVGKEDMKMEDKTLTLVVCVFVCWDCRE
jgi:hypothetical protein